jgi:hypothetical protein
MATSPLRPNAPKVELPRFIAGGGRNGGGGGGRGGAAGNADARIQQLVTALNAEGYWPTAIREISNPYIGDPPKEATPGNFGQSNVGDKWDTSPYAGNGGMGISTQTFIGNMSALIRYVDSTK